MCMTRLTRQADRRDVQYRKGSFRILIQSRIGMDALDVLAACAAQTVLVETVTSCAEVGIAPSPPKRPRIEDALPGEYDNAGRLVLAGEENQRSWADHAQIGDYGEEKVLPNLGRVSVSNTKIESTETCDRNEELSFGRIRRYNAVAGRFDPWDPLAFSPNLDHEKGDKGVDFDRVCAIPLRRGGCLRYYSKFLSGEKRDVLEQSMTSCRLYRQYSFGPGNIYAEPRVHVMLSSAATEDKEGGEKRGDTCLAQPEVPSNDTRQDDCPDSSTVSTSSSTDNPGYIYHGIKMKAQPIQNVPEVSRLASELAAAYRLPGNKWSIGVDLIVYRDGTDSIGWHADDTQDEWLVMCVVVEVPSSDTRPMQVRPKRKGWVPQHGDEEIDLYVKQGDAYEMDGIMQQSYEHSLPKQKTVKTRRCVLIFRQGRAVAVKDDNGYSLAAQSHSLSGNDILSPDTSNTYAVKFGHPSHEVIEGESGYSRGFLFTTGAHRLDQRGINGNTEDGCDSIIVSRQSASLREDDGLEWLRYTSSRRQGGGALCRSCLERRPVRVFRSSALVGSKYAPPMRAERRTSYRYDGLYRVTQMWDRNGNATGDYPPIANGQQHTFLLERCPVMPYDACEDGSENLSYNRISIQELWDKILQSWGFSSTPFASVRPQMTLTFLPNDPDARTSL